jgi:cell division protein FtsN
MNKNQPRPAEGEAAEGKKNKDWDPNAGLPGRLPPKPQAGASAPEEAAAPSTPAPAAPATATATAPAPAAAPAAAPPAKSSDALGDLARSRSESAKPAEPAPRPAAAETPAADPFQYFVQVGAFRNPEEAEQLRAKLLLQGLQAKISEREQGGRVVHRVRLGPFERREEADKVRERLDGGSSAVVVRVQR